MCRLELHSEIETKNRASCGQFYCDVYLFNLRLDNFNLFIRSIDAEMLHFRTD